MLRSVSGKMFCAVLGVVFCLSCEVVTAKPAGAEKSNEFYAKLAVEKLNALWQQYATAESTSGRKFSQPKTFGAACKLMLEAKLIDAVPSARGIEGWQITFTSGDMPHKCSFGYQKREVRAADTSDIVAKDFCKSTAATLNSAWQQYVASEMAADRTPPCPDDYETACKIIVDAKFYDTVPNPKQYPKWEVNYVKGATPQECKFEVAKAAKKPSKKYARKKSEKALLVQSRASYCSTLNSAWLKYVAAAKGSQLAIPENYAAACKTLIDKDYIKSAPQAEVDGYTIEFVKGSTAAECKFELTGPEKDGAK